MDASIGYSTRIDHINGPLEATRHVFLSLGDDHFGSIHIIWFQIVKVVHVKNYMAHCMKISCHLDE